MNTKFDLKLLESQWAKHFSTEEKLLLKKRFSHQREFYLSLKQMKIFSPPPQVNTINYHKALNVNNEKLILIVGGEGKSTNLNCKTFNLYPGANANITGDICKTRFKNNTFDVVYFERVGFCESIEDSRGIDARLSSIDESHRILKSGGQLIIVTGIKYEKMIENILQQNDGWQKGKKMEIAEANFPIDKFASENFKNSRIDLSVTPLHFLKS